MSEIGANQTGIIGSADTLHKAREIARKNEGSEYIAHEKNGSYTVHTLENSEINRVKSKPDAKFDVSVVEFSVQEKGKEEIVTNTNASFANKIISKGTTATEAVGDAAEYLEEKGKEALQKVKVLANQGMEFFSPLADFISNPFTQYLPKMRSYQSNCGPTSGAIIAESFLPGISKGNDDFILKVRDVVGPKTGALTEAQVIKGVEKVTNGQVKGKLIKDNYRPNDCDKLLADIKKEFNEGHLLMMCTGFSKRVNGPRHYVAIVGIDDKGNLLISDPYKKSGPGTPPDVWDVEKLQQRMNLTKTARYKTTSLTSFSKL